MKSSLLERLPDFLGSLEAVASLEHVVGWLGSRGAGLLRVGKKVRETLPSVLSAFNAGHTHP